jgi:hypothetical protein
MRPTAVERSALPGSQRDVPPGFIRITCRCCDMAHKVKDRDGDVPTLCDLCTPHQGSAIDKRLARAEKHEEMLRQVVGRYQRDLASTRAALDSAKEQVAAALSSRGALASRLVYATEDAGTHRCATVQIGREEQVVGFARKHRERRGEYWDSDEP